ncbi:MAG: beta-ketoacyl-[acyl-carrier-protein] synthase family protein [Deltaproteobacteria bacterium]|nr:beta-ketoacyl-[acyl-carrier-protein] synthase family protein [Deltaproteobacteria bacterium]
MDSSKALANLPSSGIGMTVAITGLGIISCIGQTLNDVARSLKQGKSGVVLDEDRIKRGFRSGLTGRIADFDPRQWGLKRKHLNTMGEPAQYAAAAAIAAVKDSGLLEEHLRNDRCGLIFGNDSTVGAAVEAIDLVNEHGGTHYLGSGYVFKSMNSTISMNLAAYFGTQGANWSLSAACASGAHVIGQALMLIRSGLQDIVIVGGAQETNWQSVASFDALGAFSRRHDAPEKASRPFDAERDGLVPSGGAACLILEELEHARKRGARIYGIVRGYGFASQVGANLSEPSLSGAIRAMQMALQDGGIGHQEVDYINAHATSTPAGDLVEAQAIAAVFGEGVPVSSTKSMTGHECWMAGASEALYTILMAREGFIAPNLNFNSFQPDCPKIKIITACTPARIRMALSNSFGFGGTYASLLFDFRHAEGCDLR